MPLAKTDNSVKQIQLLLTFNFNLNLVISIHLSSEQKHCLSFVYISRNSELGYYLEQTRSSRPLKHSDKASQI